MDLSSSNSGCARRGSGVAPPLGVVKEDFSLPRRGNLRTTQHTVRAAAFSGPCRGARLGLRATPEQKRTMLGDAELYWERERGEQRRERARPRPGRKSKSKQGACVCVAQTRAPAVHLRVKQLEVEGTAAQQHTAERERERRRWIGDGRFEVFFRFEIQDAGFFYFGDKG